MVDGVLLRCTRAGDVVYLGDIIDGIFYAVYDIGEAMRFPDPAEAQKIADRLNQKAVYRWDVYETTEDAYAREDTGL